MWIFCSKIPFLGPSNISDIRSPFRWLFFSDIAHHPDVHSYVWIWMDVMQVLVYIIAWTCSVSHGLDACFWCLVFLGVGKKHSKLKTQKLNFFRWVFLSQLNGAKCVETPRHFDQPPWWRVPLCLFRLYRAKPLRERHVFDPFHLCLPIGVLEGVDVDECLGLWHLHDGVHKMMEKKITPKTYETLKTTRLFCMRHVAGNEVGRETCSLVKKSCRIWGACLSKWSQVWSADDPNFLRFRALWFKRTNLTGFCLVS